MILLCNGKISASIKPFGAELTSLRDKISGLEYIWQAGAEWPKHSPVLFPIVGSLKNGKYFYDDSEFALERHGFARNLHFQIGELNDSSVTFKLINDDDSVKIYPFKFELEVTYHLQENGLEVIYIVKNTDSKELLFSIGAHPAFKVPLTDEHSYDDYFLEFSEDEDASVWPLDNGLLAEKSIPFFKGNKLPLKKSLFEKDALVFKNLKSEQISIKNVKDSHGMDFLFKGYPFFGIWAAKGADFVCLEPWHGVTDSVNASGYMKDKDGILSLQPGNFFSCSWSVNLF